MKASTSRLRCARIAATAAILACGGVLSLVAPRALQAQWSGRATLTGRVYHSNGSMGEPKHEVGLIAEFQRTFFSADGSHFLTVNPWLRLDPSSASRSRIDFADLTWEKAWAQADLAVGMRQAAWGVAKSFSVVDVINQIDTGDDRFVARKVGQPMVLGRGLTSAGVFEAYVLPFLRTRDFAGRGGRLWAGDPVDGEVSFDTQSGRTHLDWAVRWTHILGEFDVALSFFDGTDREPDLLVSTDTRGSPFLAPSYHQMTQASASAQWTHSEWIVKLETSRRDAPGDAFQAFVGGIEFVPKDYFSVFVEYVLDGRGARARTSYQNDVFGGVRLLTQDWTIEGRMFADVGSGNVVMSTTASRRIGDSVTAAFDGRWFRGDPLDEPAHATRLDTYSSLSLNYFF